MINDIKEIYSYRSMLWSMIQSELRTRYKGSFLGFLWTFINPLLMLLVYDFIFSIVMRANIPHYSTFMFIGLLSWNLFATSVLASTSIIINKSSFVNKIYFPRAILPLSVVGGSTINYLFSLIILIPFLLISGYGPSWVWIYFPVILIFEIILASGFSLLFSALNVFARDLEHMLNVFMMLWLYLTPVLYPLTFLHSHVLQLFFKINPMTTYILSFQDIFYYHTPPHWKLFLFGSILTIAVFLIGWKVFHKLSRRFAEEV